MKLNFLLLLSLVFVGCVSNNVSMRIEGVGTDWKSATTRFKYHICSVKYVTLGKFDGKMCVVSSGDYSRAQIRAMERYCPLVFDDDGIPIDIELERLDDTQMSLWNLPYALLCGCSLCTLPFVNSWTSTYTYQLKISQMSQSQTVCITEKFWACWSLVGLNNLIPSSPLENADFECNSFDAAQQEKSARLMTQAIVAAIRSAEGNMAISSPKKRGRQIGN